MGKKEISFKATVEHQKAVAYLKELLNGFKNGEFYVQDGNNYVALKPTGTVQLEIESSQKHDREKLSIELSWSKEVVQAPTNGLIISTEKPNIVEEAVVEETEE